jgi:hypothetical protein
LALVPLPPVLPWRPRRHPPYLAAAEAGKRLFYQAIDRHAHRPPAGRHYRRLAATITEHSPAAGSHGETASPDARSNWLRWPNVPEDQGHSHAAMPLCWY